MKHVPEIASTHHEKVNGKGYPDGLKIEQIPLGGRMLALADVFDALTSRRQYRDRESVEKVWEIIEKENGQTFDPEVVKIFLEIPVNKLISILEYDQHDRLDQNELEKLAAVPFKEILSIKRSTVGKLTKRQQASQVIFDKYYLRNY
jgi:HD-GYP domain-containing protein (c-di-GMP phosphodiesterase class II)